MYNNEFIKQLSCDNADLERVNVPTTIDQMYAFMENPIFPKNVIAIRFFSDDYESTVWFVNPEYWNHNLHSSKESEETFLEGYQYTCIQDSLPFLAQEFPPEILLFPSSYFEEFDILEEYEKFERKLLAQNKNFSPRELYDMFAKFLSKKREKDNVG